MGFNRWRVHRILCDNGRHFTKANRIRKECSLHLYPLYFISLDYAYKRWRRTYLHVLADDVRIMPSFSFERKRILISRSTVYRKKRRTTHLIIRYFKMWRAKKTSIGQRTHAADMCRCNLLKKYAFRRLRLKLAALRKGLAIAHKKALRTSTSKRKKLLRRVLSQWINKSRACQSMSERSNRFRRQSIWNRFQKSACVMKKRRLSVYEQIVYQYDLATLRTKFEAWRRFSPLFSSLSNVLRQKRLQYWIRWISRYKSIRQRTNQVIKSDILSLQRNIIYRWRLKLHALYEKLAIAQKELNQSCLKQMLMQWRLKSCKYKDLEKSSQTFWNSTLEKACFRAWRLIGVHSHQMEGMVMQVLSWRRRWVYLDLWRNMLRLNQYRRTQASNFAVLSICQRGMHAWRRALFFRCALVRFENDHEHGFALRKFSRMFRFFFF